ncbi:hypothetical protein BFG57_04440 [Bacillus solimangrovi]|uniref:Uncharacterized protein n=1 Tax=Bacillus solimangrovi TaxID=1305675 RepID=A0A1E5LC84_9BACI|nr:hypothetical protein BFG57_04440 [Bacillus solimangrovi]
MFRLFFFLIGFGLAVSGGVSAIIYLNMLTIGHGVGEYIRFTSQRVECSLLPIGMLLIWLSIYWPLSKQ